MKKKDLIYVVLAVVILAVAGYLALTQLAPKKADGASTGTVVDVIGVIDSSLNDTAIAQLKDPEKVRDFTVPIDLRIGLGNTAPFGR